MGNSWKVGGGGETGQARVKVLQLRTLVGKERFVEERERPGTCQAGRGRRVGSKEGALREPCKVAIGIHFFVTRAVRVSPVQTGHQLMNAA